MIHTLLPAVLALTFLSHHVSQPIDDFFDSNGVKIRYVSAGEGQPVVLIHGWMSDSSMWGRDPAGNTKLDAAFTPGFRLIAIDCRGHGKSDKPHDPAQYGPAMAEDIVRLLDHLKIEKAHLVGYSSGTFLAGHVAANHPERVLSIVYAAQAPIIEASPKPDPSATNAPKTHTPAKKIEAPKASDPITTREPPKPADAAEVEVFAKAVEDGRDLGEYIIAVSPPHKPKPTEAQAKAIAHFMFASKDVKALAAAGRGFKHLGVPIERLKNCDVPTLFIHGQNEGEQVKSRVAAVRELLGRGELLIIEDADHLTTLSKPEFGAAIRDFLRTSNPK